MFQILWALCSVSLIVTILIHNPKSQGFGSQNQFFSGTRSAEETLNKVTWGLVLGFFGLTIYLAIRSTGL
nr:preprotein translocase SecG subunit [Proteomonas sp. NEIS-1375]